jgi:hypothetical protein
MRGTMKRFEKRTSTFSRRGGSQFVKEFIAFFPSASFIKHLEYYVSVN